MSEFVRIPWWAVLLIYLTTWPAAVLAEDTYSATDMNGTLTLAMKPCPLGGWFKDWKAAKWIFRGEFYDACWRVQPTQDEKPQIVVIDSSGVMSSHSPRAFHKDEGV